MAFTWQSIYRAGNSLEAHTLKGLLEHAGLRVRLTGENLGSAAGELPADVVEVMLWVPAEETAQAQQLIASYEKGNLQGWRCRGCGELNEGPFDWCWQCGADRPDD
ncbi:DUF2007 domain-containing protein [Photobacterium galatheae]|uniref:RanBP2-type domain-containing protein n=1 Tax=Photobacterium galatheae TaxID=1654360 RepID=A0A066RPS5_9GAMM|nr:DUF2007 domain-containing protein [Photobacterium galatheae]KDM92359.1 hypothetical protein EA58_06475 [Photobacterium galatheae]MCM0150869.1 DUF2007 domain-containing protein [Photobacterium galatheae]